VYLSFIIINTLTIASANSHRVTIILYIIRTHTPHRHLHIYSRRNSLLGCNLFHRNEIMKHIHIRVFGVVVCAIAAILHRPRICTHIYSLYNIIYTCLCLYVYIDICIMPHGSYTYLYEWYLGELCENKVCVFVFVWEMVAAWDAMMIEMKGRGWGGDETNEM
jgi:hypothetical protein